MPVTAGPIYPGIKKGLVFAIDPARKDSYPGSGTTATDLVGTHNGTFTSSPTFVNENGGVIDFDGTDRITFNNFDIGTSDLSVISWVRTTNTSFQYIIAQGGQGNSAAERGFGMATGDGYVYGFIATTTRTFVSGNPIAAINDGNWHQVAGVWDRSDKLTFYVDGVFDQEGDISSADSYNISNASNNCFLGTYGNASTGFLQGDLGPITLYLKALSAQEVTQNYNRLKGRFGLT